MQNLNQLIDHTILKPDITIEDIRKLCIEAKEYNFYSVCVNPSYVSTAYQFLKNTKVRICTVIGFPLGATSNLSKVYETTVAISDGADEVDMVINIGFLKSGRIDLVEREISAVRDNCNNTCLKVIIENCLLTDEEKVLACKIARECGADFVKTSTGFFDYGAKVEDIKIMKSAIGDSIGIKASGGIKTYEDAINMINAGANRIGSSSSIDIIKNKKN